jgi:molecular chaperone IbpA
MRTFDLSPLQRSTIGFERLFSLLDQASEVPAFPPYNIERTGEDSFRITLAVAGFKRQDLAIEFGAGVLAVRGSKTAEIDQKTDFLHRGIANRSFERKFRVAEYVTPTGSSLENGLLHVELVRAIPEAAKVRQIPINAGAPSEHKELADA